MLAGGRSLLPFGRYFGRYFVGSTLFGGLHAILWVTRYVLWVPRFHFYYSFPLLEVGSGIKGSDSINIQNSIGPSKFSQTGYMMTQGKLKFGISANQRNPRKNVDQSESENENQPSKVGLMVCRISNLLMTT